MKSFTNIEQSKKLAEILPIENADMFYADGERLAVWNNKDVELDEDDIPCWSLAVLINLLPFTLEENYGDFDLEICVKDKMPRYVRWDGVFHDDFPHNFEDFEAELLDNVVDSIIWLKERGLL